MSSSWVRLWTDMPNDPKWRLIARISNQPIGIVIAVYIHMMVSAENIDETDETLSETVVKRHETSMKRGEIKNWSDEVIACALDLKIDDVIAIRQAMQGRVLEGNLLTGWAKRQPLKKDYSYGRVKAFRERKRKEKENLISDETDETLSETVVKRHETRTDTDTEGWGEGPPTPPLTHIKKTKKKISGSRLPFEALPTEWQEWAKSDRGWADEEIQDVWLAFRDYWASKGGKTAEKSNWDATWHIWCRRELIRPSNQKKDKKIEVNQQTESVLCSCGHHHSGAYPNPEKRAQNYAWKRGIGAFLDVESTRYLDSYETAHGVVTSGPATQSP